MALKILNGRNKKCDYNKYVNLHQIYLVTDITVLQFQINLSLSLKHSRAQPSNKTALKTNLIWDVSRMPKNIPQHARRTTYRVNFLEYK